MYLNDYHPGLSGSFKKRLKKLGKVAAHVGAAVATGGASLAVSAAMINAKKQQKAQAAAAAQEQALIAQITAPPPIAAPASPPSVKTGGDIAPTMVPSGPMPTFSTTEAPAGSRQPAWMMPALLVGGGLLIATMLRGRS